jgi:hypothetical protein
MITLAETPAVYASQDVPGNFGFVGCDSDQYETREQAENAARSSVGIANSNDQLTETSWPRQLVKSIETRKKGPPMTTRQFQKSVNEDIKRLIKQGETKPYALQVCNAGKMPEDFDSWLKANGDSIDIGGNWTPNRVEANKDVYEKGPFDV